ACSGHGELFDDRHLGESTAAVRRRWATAAATREGPRPSIDRGFRTLRLPLDENRKNRAATDQNGNGYQGHEAQCLLSGEQVAGRGRDGHCVPPVFMRLRSVYRTSTATCYLVNSDPMLGGARHGKARTISRDHPGRAADDGKTVVHPMLDDLGIVLDQSAEP